MAKHHAPELMTEDLSTCISTEGPLHSLLKHPHQAPTPQDDAAGLVLFQQTLTPSQTLYPMDSSNLPLGEAAPVDPTYVSGWPPFNVMPQSLIQSQRTAAQRATDVLKNTGIVVENASVVQADIQNMIPNAPPTVLQKEAGFDIPVQATSRPKTYPYTHSNFSEVSRKPQPPLKRPRRKNKPLYSEFRQPEWQKQRRGTQDVYSPVGSNTASVWMSPPSASLSFSDSTLDEMHTPRHQQDVLNQSLPSNFHSCAITRNSLGSVVPSLDLLPCMPYIPPKCPDTLTEAACMYIDYLIQQNENLIHISYCEFLQPFTKEKHKEFIDEAMKGPCQMPSDKFREWLKQFNVDVEVVTGEMQQSDDAEEDLEDFDASLFLRDIQYDSQNKESPQHVANLAQFIPGLLSEKQADGTVIIQCLPEDLTKSFGQNTELLTQPDINDIQANVSSPVQHDANSGGCPASNDTVPASTELPTASDSIVIIS